MTLPRHTLTQQIEHALTRNPVVSLIGPRQCGKTTLARAIGKSQEATFFDLEHPGSKSYVVDEHIEAVGIVDLEAKLKNLAES